MTDHFLKLKQNLELNPSFDETVQARHLAVRRALENRSRSIKKPQLIGSLQRKTRIQPGENDGFDIDILVVLGSFDRWLSAGDPNGISAEQALNHVYGAINTRDRYSLKNPEKDSPTVALEFADKIKVELVPAFLDMIEPIRPIKPIAPIGYVYFWKPDKKRFYRLQAYILRMSNKRVEDSLRRLVIS